MHKCPLCASPMTATFKPSDHPAIPDRTYLHCTNKAACDWCGTADDMHVVLVRRDGYARALAGGLEAHAALAETAVLG